MAEHFAIRAVDLGDSTKGFNMNVSTPRPIYPHDRLIEQRRENEFRDRKTALIMAIKACPLDTRQQEIDEALKEIATEEQRRQLKNQFDELSSEEMARALASVRRET